MLVQSGRPVGVFRTHEWAPRVLLANSNLVGDWATWPEFRRLETARPDHVRADDRRLVDLHRHPGHPAGHLRDVRRGRREAVRRHARRHADADRRLRRDGRRAAARGHHERRRLPDRRRRPRPAATAGCATATSTWSPTTWTTRSPRRSPPSGTAGRCPSAWSATPPTVFPELLRRGVEIDIVTDQTSAHDPLSYVPEGVEPADARGLRGREAGGVHRPGPRVDGQARRGDGRLPRRRRRGLRLRQLDPRRGAARRLRAGVRVPRLRAGVHPAAVLRGQGPVPVGGAVRRPGRHRRHRPGGARPVPGERVAGPVDPDGRRAGRVPGPAGADLLARLRRAGQGRACGSTRWSPPASCPRRS